MAARFRIRLVLFRRRRRDECSRPKEGVRRHVRKSTNVIQPESETATPVGERLPRPGHGVRTESPETRAVLDEKKNGAACCSPVGEAIQSTLRFNYPFPSESRSAGCRSRCRSLATCPFLFRSE